MRSDLNSAPQYTHPKSFVNTLYMQEKNF